MVTLIKPIGNCSYESYFNIGDIQNTVKFQSFNIKYQKGNITHVVYDIFVPYIICCLLLILHFPH